VSNCTFKLTYESPICERKFHPFLRLSRNVAAVSISIVSRLTFASRIVQFQRFC
jgi:hypothetical protein